MKQQKVTIQQKNWIYSKRVLPRCFICKIILVNQEYIFCRKCKTDIISAGKDPEDFIKKLEKQRLHNRQFTHLQIHNPIKL